MTDQLMAPAWSDQQRATFYYQMAAVQKDEVLGVLLAVFLGSFGLHHFYLKQNGLGILYLIFFWTGITAILGVVECFFMPGRVRQYNAALAIYISSQILAASGPDSTPTAANSHCPSCSSSIDPAALFCTHCGAAITHNQLSAQTAV